MAYRYKIYNGPMTTTAAQAAVALPTAGIKTMLQIAPPAGRYLTVVSWGYTITAASVLTSIELIQTDVAATVTAHVAAGVQPQDQAGPASPLTLGASATGYTASAEGTVAATRQFDVQDVAATNPTNLSYFYQFMPDERPSIAASTFLRVRATATTATGSMICWVTVDA